MEVKDPKQIEKEEAGLEMQQDEDSATAPELNNATVPTPEEKENAGIEVSGPEQGAETEPEPEAAPVAEQQAAPEAEAEEGGQVDPNLGIAESTTEKMFTQSQVDEIAGKARKEGREKALRDEFARYGVNSAEELDELFGDAQRLSTLQEMYDADKKAWAEKDTQTTSELATVKERIALLESGIDKNRYEDAKLILKGKGLEVTAENIAAELATHPEWKAEQEKTVGQLPFKKSQEQAAEANPNPGQAPTQISVLGNNSADSGLEAETDYDKAMKMFFRK